MPRSTLAIVCAAGLMTGCGSSSKSDSPNIRPTTSSSIALTNLSGQISLFENKLSDSSYSPAEALELINLYKAKTRFLGEYSAFDKMQSLAETTLVDYPEEATSWLISASAKSAVHKFQEALKDLETAKQFATNLSSIEDAERNNKQALADNLEDILDERQEKAASYPNYDTYLMLASVEAELGLYEQADASLEQSIDAYRGSSPFAYALAYFQRGLLWGELSDEPNTKLAQEYYEVAVAYLPEYVQASVHLSEVYSSQNQWSRALKQLQNTTESEDPEGRGKLAEIHNSQGREDLSNSYKDETDRMYRSLLQQHQAAFADHAAEFYLGPGDLPLLAKDLAEVNLNVRPTKGAYDLAIVAAERTRDEERRCELIQEVRNLSLERSDLQELADTYGEECL